MFIHNINPVLLQLGPFQVRYYGIIYALGFILAYYLLRRYIRQKKLHMLEKDLDTYMIYLIFGVVLGARLFEIIFYNLSFYLNNPVSVARVLHATVDKKMLRDCQELSL